MGVFGVDVSNHQSSFNFSGWDFAFIKSSEGDSFKDWMFSTHLANARKAGCLVAAYHYQRNVSARAQVDLIKSMVPSNIPVIIDVEEGSGPISITREIVRLLRAEGYESPLLYVPRWFWQKPVSQGGLGGVSLEGLPRLWASWYPDYVARPREQGIAVVPQSAWSDYGGLKIEVMQFTSTPFDQNYYPGSRDDLARLLNGGTGGGGAEEEVTQEELYNTIATVIKDMANGNAPDLAEALQKVVLRSKVVVKNDDGKTWEDQLGGIIPAVDRRLARVETKVDAMATGTGYTLDQIANAVADKVYASLDVDIVRRHQGS